jgi:DNA-binding beta-propeller fold protein YncE
MMHRLNRIVFAILALLCVIGMSLPAMAAKDYLYVPCPNHLVIIDCTTDTIVKTLHYSDYIVGCTPSPDGKRFYMNSWKSIYVVDTEKDQIIDKIDFFTDLNRVVISPGIAISPDNKYMYMSVNITKKKLNIPRLNVLPPQMIVYDLGKKEIAKSFEIPPTCNAVVTLRDDPDHVVLMAQDIFKLNLKNGKMTKLLGVLNPEPGQPVLNSLVIWNNWSPGDHGIFANPAYSMENMFYTLIDSKGNLTVIEAEDIVLMYSSILSPDKKYIYGVMDEAYKIDAKTGKTLAMDPVERGTSYACALTSDGRKLYVGPGGPDISVYDTATMKSKGYIALPADGVVMNRISK